MKKTALVVSLLASSLLTSCRKDAAPTPSTPAARAEVLPEAPFDVTGVVHDDTGQPRAGVEVALFGPRATWLRQLSYATAKREPDDGRDCRRWPAACHQDADRAETLRRLDAGTLEFPKALARGRTDANGRWVLRAPTRDAVVVAWTGSELALDDNGLDPFVDSDVTLSPDPLVVPSWAREVLGVNALTSQVWRWVNDGGVAPMPDTRTVAFFAPTPEKNSFSAFQLVVDGGPVDGVGLVTCRTSSERFVSDGGLLKASAALEGNDFCHVLVTAGDFERESVVLAGLHSMKLELSRRKALTVKWSPASAAETEVTVDWPRPEEPGIGSLGTRGGGRVPGFGRFDGGTAWFPSLVARDATELEVQVRQPGTVAAWKRFEVSPDAKVELSLVEVPGLVARVVDESGRAVPGLVVNATPLDGGRATWVTTDERGGAWLVAAAPGPHRLEAAHPVLGRLDVRSDAHDGRLVLRHGAEVQVAVTAEDGGVARGARLSLAVEDDRLRVWADDAGVVRLFGLEPGRRELALGLDEDHLAHVTIDVPDAGQLRSALVLPTP